MAMFEKVLIANRGEIAVRVMRTCREMGISSVAVFSEADRDALHVETADEALYIGPAPAEESYLDIGAILSAASDSGAEAVHPGYGFLSENPGFAEACSAEGLTFIGPKPDTLRLLGDKAQAKKLAESVGVPVIPGYYARKPSNATLLRKASEVGFPVLIKAVGGGGGRGMRLVEDGDDLKEAIAGARREAKAAFGDDALMLEKYISRPRHIEVQVFGDNSGAVVHLGERECSIQRRYQKVIEESPSPVVDTELRQRLGEAAVKLAAKAGYVNAGTVEFLLDENGEFYFLEVNPRLQVEHPVTEGLTGMDLVRLQLMVACGEPLPFGQQDVSLTGHAIEVRVCAEDPAQGYIPSTGTIQRFQPPSGTGVRHDGGFNEGAEVSVFYDSLLAKLIVHGHDRRQSLERLRSALKQYDLTGVTTNLSLLRSIISDPEFAAGRLDTGFIERRIEPHLRQVDEVPPQVLMSAVAYKLSEASLLAGGYSNPNPWNTAGPWRLGRWGLEYSFQYGEQSLKTMVSKKTDTRSWEVRSGDETYDIELEYDDGAGIRVRWDGAAWPADVAPEEEGLRVDWEGKSYLLEPPRPDLGFMTNASAADAEASSELTAPMPGMIDDIRVQEGEQVSARQTLVVLEAMKIEHLITAPFSGTVARITCQEGQQVGKGAVLLELERS